MFAIRVPLLTIAVLIAIPIDSSAGTCSVLVPEQSELEPSVATSHCPGTGVVCEVSDCSGWVGSAKGPIQIVYRSEDNRSKLIELTAGERQNLSDLRADSTLSSALRSLIDHLSGSDERSVAGGRYAIQPGTGAGEVPSGQIAVLGDGISFSIAGAAIGDVYLFYPQENPAAVTRVPQVDGKYRIDAALLPGGQRFRGGLSGDSELSFQTAAAAKLARVAAELESPGDLSSEADAYRRALILFDNGLSWNARLELQARYSDTENRNYP